MFGAALVLNPRSNRGDMSTLASFPQKLCLFYPCRAHGPPLSVPFLQKPSQADPPLAFQGPFKFGSEFTPPLF